MLGEEVSAVTESVPIVLAGAICDGTEAALNACPGFNLGMVPEGCRHTGDVYVVCTNDANPGIVFFEKIISPFTQALISAFSLNLQRSSLAHRSPSHWRSYVKQVSPLAASSPFDITIHHIIEWFNRCMSWIKSNVNVNAADMEGKTRLANGSADPRGTWEYGRLEIMRNGFWSNVCSNDHFTPDSAQVACQALGYGGGAALRFTQAYANSLSQVGKLLHQTSQALLTFTPFML